MNCPACNVELKLSDRQGVEIDYCPKCRGVWLDRGELDKIIERSAGEYDSDRGDRYDRYTDSISDRDYRDDDYERNRYGHKGRKRKSFLGDLFDFD